MAVDDAPPVTRDPRFEAGRELRERGLADQAINVYATLLEETIHKYGSESIEAAPAHFEYGNALLRAATKKLSDDTTTKDEHDSDTLKDDLDIALETMENAFSIYDLYKSDNDKDKMLKSDNNKSDENTSDGKYLDWSMEQIPRVLMGIGDALSTLKKHADAADAYSRALDYRKAKVKKLTANKSEDELEDVTLEHLRAHRLECEAAILISEELLSCTAGFDVVTTETQSLIVKDDERISYAKGYYDQAKDALQEAVFVMGHLASKKATNNDDLAREKEDVCFMATLVMGVGESLADFDDDDDCDRKPPAKKKLKQNLSPDPADMKEKREKARLAAIARLDQSQGQTNQGNNNDKAS